MGFITNIEVLIKSMASKKEIADLEREFLQSKENAEKSFDSEKIAQTSFSEIDACRYFVETLIPQGKKEFYCCIQTRYSRKSVCLTPSTTYYAQELGILQNQNNNDEKIVKKAKQRIISGVYSIIKQARTDKVNHETHTIVGYTDSKEYADKWGCSSTNPIANKTDEELYRIWESISHKDKLDVLSTRLRNIKPGKWTMEIIAKIIKLGNPFSQYGLAKTLYQVMRCQPEGTSPTIRIAEALTKYDSILAEVAASPESIDLSAETQLGVIQQALIIREKLGLDFIPIFKNGTLWKSIEDMKAAANPSTATDDDKLEYQGQLIAFGDAMNIAKSQTAYGGGGILDEMENLRQQRQQRQQEAMMTAQMNAQTNAIYDTQISALKVRLAQINARMGVISMNSSEYTTLKAERFKINGEISKLENLKK